MYKNKDDDCVPTKAVLLNNMKQRRAIFAKHCDQSKLQVFLFRVHSTENVMNGALQSNHNSTKTKLRSSYLLEKQWMWRSVCNTWTHSSGVSDADVSLRSQLKVSREARRLLLYNCRACKASFSFQRYCSAKQGEYWCVGKHHICYMELKTWEHSLSHYLLYITFRHLCTQPHFLPCTYTHLEQFAVQGLPLVHFNLWTGTAGDQTSNPTFTGLPAWSGGWTNSCLICFTLLQHADRQNGILDWLRNVTAFRF